MSERTHATRSFSISTAISGTSLSRLASQTQPPLLEELKLSNILNGETCPPISFPDFAAFVANKEFTTENLLFILWFRSYKARFEQLDAKVKETIPIPSTRLGDRYDPYGYLDRPAASTSDNQAGKFEPDGPVIFNEPFRDHASSLKPSAHHTEVTHNFRPCNSCTHTSDTQCPSCDARPRRHSRLFSITQSIMNSRRASSASAHRDNKVIRPILHATMHPPLPPAGTVLAEPADQPFREEAQRAFATFLRKGGSRELGISDEMRQFTKLCLARSTAPEVFSPLHEEIYHVVETQSLPHFLQHAKSNINRPKQLFWYMVGFADFSFGVLIYLLLTLLLPTRPFGVRAYRLFSTIFVTFGIMQAYSAYRGFCSQVWGRSHRQVRPWEMDDLDDEETVVECDGEGSVGMEMKEERPSSMGTTTNMADHFDLSRPTERVEVVDLRLPSEVRPLADLGGVASLSLGGEGGDGDSDSDFVKEHSPVPSKSDTVAVALSVPVLDERDMSEVERRQLEIRRTTVKAPCPSEAFPISDDAIPFVLPAPPRISLSEARQRREISPFVSDEILPHQPRVSNGQNRNSNRLSASSATALGGAPLARTKSSLPSLAAQRTSKEISAILLRLRRAAPSPSNNGNGNGGADVEDDGLDPLSPSSKRKDKSRDISGGHHHYNGGAFKGPLSAKEEKKRAKVFGPEKLVEDPRVKKVYSDIKRDILIVGSLVAAIWIAMCLAVPCKGLAS
ncbi:hypothetical protein IAU59_001812 [Kwoniella sp. CBS 9459]